MHLLYSRMIIGVLYFIGSQSASFANQDVYSQQQTCTLVSSKQQFYSGGACNFKPRFFLLASNVMTTFSLSITQTTVLWDGYYKFHLQMLQSLHSERNVYRQSEILEFSILGCLYFLFFFSFSPSRVQLSFLNKRVNVMILYTVEEITTAHCYLKKIYIDNLKTSI